MKVSENWLREWVSPSASTTEIADQLTMAGLEVDGVESTDWYFEDSTNSVIFTVIPPEGSEITMTYAVWSCQEEE